jgi:hypothetical protein
MLGSMQRHTAEEPATIEHMQADLCEILRIMRHIEMVIERYERPVAALRDSARFRKLGKGRDAIPQD